MRKFIIKHSEYLLVFGLFIVNSILVGLLKFNFIISNLIYLFLWIMINYLIYLPFDTSEQLSYQKCEFKKFINEVEPLIEKISSKYQKCKYLTLVSLFQNIINPSDKSIKEYLSLTKTTTSLTINQQLAYDTEMLLICSLLEKHNETKILIVRIKKKANSKKNKMTNLRLNRALIIYDLFTNRLEGLNEDIEKYYIQITPNANLYQEVKNNFILAVYYYKTKEITKAKEKFEYVIKNAKEIFLVTKAKEFLNQINNNNQSC